MSPESSTSYRVVSAALRVASLVVPRHRRTRWLEEWRAEVWHALQPDGPRTRTGPHRVMVRAAGSFADAARVRVEDLAEAVRGAAVSGLDVRLALRLFWRRPAASLAVVLTMGIALGAGLAVFTVADRVLLRPLPYEAPGELVMVFRTVPRFGFDRSPASYPDFADWDASARSFTSLAAYGYLMQVEVRTEGATRWVGYRVTWDLFGTLGVAPALGRGFTAADDRPEAQPVAILSHGLHESRFGGDPSVIGRTVTLDDEPTTIVGVMPRGFAFPDAGAEYWRPLRGDAARMERDTNFLTVIGRLAPGATARSAQSEISELAAAIDRSAPVANEGFGVFVEPRHDFEVRNAKPALLVFSGAVLLVLLVAAANVASVQLSRVVARRRELGLRSALGAGRGRLASQLVMESLVLAVASGVVGVFVARMLLGVLRVVTPPGIPRLEEARLDVWILLLAVVLVVGIGVLFGVVPALWGARRASDPVIPGGGSGGTGNRWVLAAHRSFATAQIALAIGLSIGAALLVHSFARLTSVEPGFDARSLTYARVSLPERMEPVFPAGAEDLPTDSLRALLRPQLTQALAARGAFLDEVTTRVGRLPGVEEVSLAYGVPFGSHRASTLVANGDAPATVDERPAITTEVVGQRYFETMRIPLRGGRGFTREDDPESLPVAVVNEALAELVWRGESPVGRRILVGDEGREVTVVGVVADARQRSLEERTPVFYTPLAQTTWPDAVFLVVRSAAGPARLAPLLRREVASIDPGLPVTEVAAAEDLLAGTTALPRFRTVVLTAFGLLALLVAATGTYGVVAYQVGERTREIGIRVALGATRTRVVTLILDAGLKIVLGGAVAGVALALVLTRFLEAMLYGVGTRDAVAFSGAVAAAVLVTAAACYVPARRALQAFPLDSLRAD